MKILVTGSGGFIGYHLAYLHIAKGDKIFIIDNLYKNKGNIDKDLDTLPFLDLNKNFLLCKLIQKIIFIVRQVV